MRPLTRESGLPWPAMPAAFAGAGPQRGRAGRLCRLRARCLPGQSLRAGHATVAAPGPRRARLRTARSFRSRWGWRLMFLFGGLSSDPTGRRGALEHGDVVVWGGPARLRYPRRPAARGGRHPLTGRTIQPDVSQGNLKRSMRSGVFSLLVSTSAARQLPLPSHLLHAFTRYTPPSQCTRATIGAFSVGPSARVPPWCVQCLVEHSQPLR